MVSSEFRNIRTYRAPRLVKRPVVLAVTSSGGPNSPKLDLAGDEKQAWNEFMLKADPAIQFAQASDPTLDTVVRLIIKWQPVGLIFSGHGARLSSGGAIVLTNERGEPHFVPLVALASMLAAVGTSLRLLALVS